MSDLTAALAERVLKKARAAGVKLATAESCCDRWPMLPPRMRLRRSGEAGKRE